MNTLKDGGPAFPRPGFTAEQTESQEGMSLRDWFAGQALIGLITGEPYGFPPIEVARCAYEIADAMLAAREQPTTQTPS